MGAFQKFWFENKWDKMTFHLEIFVSEVAEKQSRGLDQFQLFKFHLLYFFGPLIDPKLVALL